MTLQGRRLNGLAAGATTAPTIEPLLIASAAYLSADDRS
jgi:hypothetical protein